MQESHFQEDRELEGLSVIPVTGGALANPPTSSCIAFLKLVRLRSSHRMSARITLEVFGVREASSGYTFLSIPNVYTVYIARVETTGAGRSGHLKKFQALQEKKTHESYFALIS